MTRLWEGHEYYFLLWLKRFYYLPRVIDNDCNNEIVHLCVTRVWQLLSTLLTRDVEEVIKQSERNLL